MAYARVYGPLDSNPSGDDIIDEYRCEVFGSDLPPGQQGHDSWTLTITVTPGMTVADQEAAIVQKIQDDASIPGRTYDLPADHIQFTKATRGV